MKMQDLCYEIRQKLKSLKEIEIIAIALFGSSAKLGEYAGSDVDLLVVADDISENLIQRIPDIVKIKKALCIGLPLDILLVSRDECQSNFRNHNPLYLDIVFDAKIIYGSGFLEDLIKETKDYIDSSNIRRNNDSWVFPVEYRKETYL